MKNLKVRVSLLAALVCILCVGQASALEYSFDAPSDYLFARATSEDNPYQAENQNVDRSKNVALIPPGFGTPTSYLPGSGEYLTPNLVPGALSGGLVSSTSGTGFVQTGSVAYPSAAGADTTTTTPPAASSLTAGLIDGIVYPTVDIGTSIAESTAFTEVTSNLYYTGGYLGILKIPSLGVNVKIYEGTDSTQLSKGAGHFIGTSIWNGNVCVAGHNRGVNCYFGDIHTLRAGDTITLTTQLGTRTYAVTSVSKVLETDVSGTTATTDNQITLYTCVRDESAYRWCVKAAAV